MNLVLYWLVLGAETSHIQLPDAVVETLFGVGNPEAVPPRLEPREHAAYDQTPLGNMVSKSLIHQSQDGIVCKVAIAKQWYVAKFVNDCVTKRWGMSDEHPLVTEGMFLAKLNHTNIAPKIFYVSPPAVLTPGMRLLSRFASKYLIKHSQECLRLQPAIRFMVQELLGPTLHDFMKPEIEATEQPSKTAVRRFLGLVIKSIELLERLHAEGVVHGDIHMSNIAFAEIERERLVLLDFQMALTFDQLVESNKVKLPHSLLALHLLSPWQLEGEQPGPRDDVFRLLLNAANRLSGSVLLNRIALKATQMPTFESRVALWRIFHQTEPLFANARLEKTDQPALVRDQLEELVLWIKRVPSVLAPVPYEELKRQLRSVIDLVGTD